MLRDGILGTVGTGLLAGGTFCRGVRFEMQNRFEVVRFLALESFELRRVVVFIGLWREAGVDVIVCQYSRADFLDLKEREIGRSDLCVLFWYSNLEGFNRRTRLEGSVDAGD